MPDVMIMTNLNVDKRSEKRERKLSDGTVNIAVVAKNTLKMSLSGKPRINYDNEVRGFGDMMRSSQILKDLGLERVSISQKEATIDTQKVMLYDIKCILIAK